MENLKKEILSIHERNKRVEIDKSWENSVFRKIIIAILTYLVIVLFFVFVDLPKPFINAIVPTLGFLLSTASLRWFKKFWVRFFYKKEGSGLDT